MRKLLAIVTTGALGAATLLSISGLSPAAAAVPTDVTQVRSTPTTVDAGFAYVVFIDGIGRPFGLGNGNVGQFTGQSSSTTPRLMTGLPEGVSALSISADYDETVVVASDGKVYGTGVNNGNALTGAAGPKLTLTPLTGLPEGVTAVAASVGISTVLVLGSDQKVYHAGSQDFGSFAGRTGPNNTLSPLAALPNDDVPAAVFAGNFNGAVVAQDGSVYATGFSNAQQLFSSPAPATTWGTFAGLPGGAVVTSVALGIGHISLLLNDGSVLSVGSNDGRFGSGPTPSASSTLVPAVGGPNLLAISSSGNGGQNVGFAADGTAYGTGLNGSGQLTSVGSSVTQFTALTEAAPIGTVVEVASGQGNSVVRDALGVLYGTGANTFGQIGGTNTDPKTALTLIPGQPIVAVAAPTISGSPLVGQTLQAVDASWVPNVGTTGFQWLRDGEPIPGATGSSYLLTAADDEAAVSVRATRSQTDFIPGSRTSSAVEVTFAPLVLGQATQISGNVQVGQVLTATPATWTPSDVQRSFAWFRAESGGRVPVGTGATYTVKVADLGEDLVVVETASKVDFTDGSSEATAGPVVEGPFTSVAAPVITSDGSPAVGEQLGVTPGAAVPAAETRTYQWLRNGTPVEGATGATYVLGVADLGATITVSETVDAVGYVAQTNTSSGVGLIGEGPFVSVADPVITSDGSPAFGEQLGVTPGAAVPAAETRTYQWLRNSAPIDGATGTTYVLAAADVGASITVAETVDANGFLAETNTSAALGPVAAATFASVADPTIAGTARVGSTLTAGGGAANPAPDSVSRRWLRDGAPIVGATGATYRLTTADAGRSIRVEVTTAKAGYASVLRLSAPALVPAVNTVKPTFKGTTKVGKTLTAVRGTWFGAGYTYTFQWLRNGAPIAKATKATYKLVKADKKKSVSVRVTARRSGFATVTATSTAKKVS